MVPRSSAARVARRERRRTANQTEPNFTLGVVVPVCNEEAALPSFHARLTDALGQTPASAHIIYVDDGSVDATPSLLRELAGRDSRVTVIRLSRNFGNQAALTAGLDAAGEDAVIMMDGDGEHPPSLIPAMVDAYRAGHDVVLTRRHRDRRASLFKRWSAASFFRFINWVSPIRIEPEAADFRLVSRQALAALQGLREQHRFLRGLVAWTGFRPVVIPYEQGDRLGGRSKWTVRRLVGLAADAIVSFSARPLLAAYGLGVVLLVLGIASALLGWIASALGSADRLTVASAALMAAVLGVGGLICLALGIVGTYIAAIADEVRGRPLYVIKETYGRRGTGVTERLEGVRRKVGP